MMMNDKEPAERKDLFFQLSEPDEHVVRTYECTRLRKLFSPEAVGYLTITNKRVVFHSQAKSITGQSQLINEMPLEDVAGIRSYLGVSISWIQFALVALAMHLGASVVSTILPTFFTGWIFALILMLPYILVFLLTGNLLNQEVKDRVFRLADEAFPDGIDFRKAVENFRPYGRVLFYAGLVLLAWTFINSPSFPVLLRFPLLLVLYFVVYLFVFGRHHVFSLAIGSRTMKGTGINIPGDSFRALFLRQNTAAETINAAPAVDAEQVTRELGALLMDINQLGDLGIEKWRLPAPEDVT